MQQNSPITSADGFPPQQEAQLDSSVLNEAIKDLSVSYLAKQAGVKFSDAEIKSAAEKIFEEETMKQRMELVMQHKLDANDSSDKAFDAALTKEGQMTLSVRRKSFHDAMAKALKDSQARKTWEMQTAGPLLLDAIKAKIKPTDAEVKASYDSSEFKRVVFAQSAASNAQAQIDKAQADLKAGMSFEQVIDRYTSETAPKGKEEQRQHHLVGRITARHP